MSLTLNYSIIIKFYVVKIKIILIKKTDYPEHCLNIETDNIYKINIYIPACLNGTDIVKILNTHQKLSILKKNDIIICNIIGSIIYNA